MTDEQLADAAIKTTLFARVSPAHKQRIIAALQSRQHTVGFMGDGINDAPALRTADVGISVDTAVDIAKESADMILLEKSLMVLEEGVIEGRKVFANILKYVRMGASSNFGNMFSVLGASVFVPFLPMAPIQILANNLLYDISQTAIPTDDVDPEQVEKPRPWDIKQLTRFIVFIGPCSSIFDYTTFFMMLYLFGCWNVSTPEAAAHSASLFQTGWFVESLLTQTLIIHVIRTNRDPVPTEPSVVAADGDVRGHHGDRHRHPVHATGKLPRLHPASAALLAAAGAHAAVLRRPDATGQNLAAPKEMDLRQVTKPTKGAAALPTTNARPPRPLTSAPPPALCLKPVVRGGLAGLRRPGGRRLPIGGELCFVLNVVLTMKMV